MGNDKILLLFPDGVGVRNYLYSNVFKNCATSITLLHNFENSEIQSLKKEFSFENDIFLPKYKETFKEKFLRELICLSRLYYNSKIKNNQTILTNWNWNQKTFTNKIFYKTIQILAIFFKSYKRILFLESKYQKVIRKTQYYRNYKQLLIELRPKSIFCSHQRAIQTSPIFAAANDLDIKTSSVIFSWDNLPKARLALKAQKYLVWSEYMKNEMQEYYPEVEQERIIVTGTPQFEFYNDKNNIIEKEVFYKKYNLDFSKKIVCFSGDDEMTSPDDPKYLDDIASSIKENNLQDKIQILLRRCPVDLSGRFDKIIEKHSNIIKEAPPIWIFNGEKSWTNLFPAFDDVKLLVSTAFYSDVVINIGSTMAFDFAMFKKPCIFINYNQEKKENPNWSVDTIYRYQHFRSMDGLDAVGWINKKEEITNIILKSINIPNEIGPQRQQWFEKIICCPTDKSSTLLLNEII